MQVRTFESKDMASGLQMIKKELGPDALILSTKTVRDKSAGLLGKRLFEITAAIDGDPPKLYSRSNPLGTTEQEIQGAGSSAQPAFRHVIDDSVDQYLSRPAPPTSKTGSAAPLFTQKTEPQTDHSSLEGEVAELKELVKTLSVQINQISEAETSSRPNSQNALQVKNDSIENRGSSSQLQGDHILSTLIQKGINVETARTITSFIRESLTEQELADSDHVLSTMVDILQNLIEVRPQSDKPQLEQQRIAFVGPTGVGKTTTLAKIAAAYLKKHSNSVALITIDTYRIAAVEQLKVYGDIMHLPVDVVITPGQLQQALDKHKDKELILIDTAGRSPKDNLSIAELANFLKAELSIEKHLVLSASTREDELLNTIKQFQALEITNTIFTKIDECTQLGILLNIQLQNPTPLSYLTNGQKVPEDLLHISPQRVAKLIMSNEEGSLND